MPLTYNDTELQRLFTELDPDKRLKALKGAFRREANMVRKTALNNLRGSIRTDKDLEKGVRAVVFKRQAGFKVTVATKRAGKNGGVALGFHKNRQGLEKPILIWAEAGTKERKTKTKTKVFTRSRKGHSTGRMKRYGFLRQTQADVADTVTNDLHNEIERNVVKIAKKYGCT